MSTNSTCFHGKIRKIFTWISLLSGAMLKTEKFLNVVMVLLLQKSMNRNIWGKGTQLHKNLF